MKLNVMRITGPLLIVLVFVAVCSVAYGANDQRSEAGSAFYRTASMGGSGLPEVSLALVDHQLHRGLVSVVATVNDRDRLDRLVDLQVSVPSGRELQERIGRSRVSASPAVERSNDSTDEKVKVTKPSIRLEPATMLLFGAGLIGVAEVLRRKKRIK